MHLPESSYVLEQLLGKKPRHLKWVFIELDELQIKRFQEQSGTRRALYWHDGKRTAVVLRKILNTGRQGEWIPGPKKVRDVLIPRQGRSDTHDLFFFHAGLFAKNFANVGRKTELTHWISHLGGESAPKYMGPAGDGYAPVNKRMSPSQVAAYEAGLKRALGQTQPIFLSPYTEQACRQSAEEVRKIGAKPIFLVTPITRQYQIGFGSDSPGTVMSFNDAKAYAPLYRKSVRMDANHLNATGAEEFTKLVAASFAQLVDRNGIK